MEGIHIAIDKVFALHNLLHTCNTQCVHTQTFFSCSRCITWNQQWDVLLPNGPAVHLSYHIIHSCRWQLGKGVEEGKDWQETRADTSTARSKKVAQICVRQSTQTNIHSYTSNYTLLGKVHMQLPHKQLPTYQPTYVLHFKSVLLESSWERWTDSLALERQVLSSAFPVIQSYVH